MSILTARRAPRRDFVVEHLTNHWRLMDGRYYREAIVRLADGTRRVYALPEDVAA